MKAFSKILSKQGGQNIAFAAISEKQKYYSKGGKKPFLMTVIEEIFFEEIFKIDPPKLLFWRRLVRRLSKAPSCTLTTEYTGLFGKWMACEKVPGFKFPF